MARAIARNPSLVEKAIVALSHMEEQTGPADYIAEWRDLLRLPTPNIRWLLTSPVTDNAPHAHLVTIHAPADQRARPVRSRDADPRLAAGKMRGSPVAERPVVSFCTAVMVIG